MVVGLWEHMVVGLWVDGNFWVDELELTQPLESVNIYFLVDVDTALVFGTLVPLPGKVLVHDRLVFVVGKVLVHDILVQVHDRLV
jgi:hypothetical protein